MPPTSFNIHSAKTNLSRLVMRAEKGERITISRAGRPVAQLGPTPQEDRPPLSPDDPLLNLDRFAADGPGGKITSKDIDHLLYGQA